jgi:hypothetical protein
VSAALLIAFLVGIVTGVLVVLCALLWVGTRQVQAERQRLVETRQRMRP